MDQALNSQKTPHTSPLRASYGMSFVSILMKNDRVVPKFKQQFHVCENISKYMYASFICFFLCVNINNMIYQEFGNEMFASIWRMWGIASKKSSMADVRYGECCALSAPNSCSPISSLVVQSIRTIGWLVIEVEQLFNVLKQWRTTVPVRTLSRTNHLNASVQAEDFHLYALTHWPPRAVEMIFSDYYLEHLLWNWLVNATEHLWW